MVQWIKKVSVEKVGPISPPGVGQIAAKRAYLEPQRYRKNFRICAMESWSEEVARCVYIGDVT